MATIDRYLLKGFGVLNLGVKGAQKHLECAEGCPLKVEHLRRFWREISEPVLQLDEGLYGGVVKRESGIVDARLHLLSRAI